MAVTEFETFNLDGMPAKPKGFEQKFFAEVLPKFNQLVELRSQYLAISGGVEAAIESLIDGVTEESNPEVYGMLNDIAEAEELIRQLNAKVREWAESQVAESTESPDTLREQFESIKAVVAKRVAGSVEYFEMNDDIEPAEDGAIEGNTDSGKAFVKLMNLPSIRKNAKGGRVSNGFGKRARIWAKENDLKGPEGQDVPSVGVIPNWVLDAFTAATGESNPN